MKRQTFIKQAQVLRNKRFRPRRALDGPTVIGNVVKTPLAPKLSLPPVASSMPRKGVKKSESKGCAGCKRTLGG